MHAERPGGAPPPSIVLVAETAEHPELIGASGAARRGARAPQRAADAQTPATGCIEVTTTDAALAAGGTACDGYLGMLAVDARFGSRGVGRALVAAGEDAARSVYNATGVVLYVLAIRADILAWYARRGYAPTGLRADARSLIEGIHSDARLLADSDFVIVRRAL